MTQKQLIWILTIVGSTLGSFIPLLWGDGAFSGAGIVFSAIGAIAGIYLGYKLGQ
jgi:hypothetical protein